MTDTSIYNNLRPPQFADPLEQMGKVLSIRAAQQQMQLAPVRQQAAELQLQQEQRQVTEGQQLRDLFGQEPDVRKALPKVFAINPQTGLAMAKALHEQEKSQVDMEKTVVETNAKKAERFGSIAATISDEPSFHQGIATAYGEGLIGREQATALLAQGWTPQTQSQLEQIKSGAIAAKDQAELKYKDLDEKRKALEAQHRADMAPFELQGAQNNARKSGLEADELKHKLDVIANTRPADVLALVDQVVPPGTKENAALNARTKALVTAAMKRGDVPAAQQAITTASAEMRQLEVATDPRVQAGRVAVTVAGAVGREQATLDAGGLTADDYDRAGEQYGRTGIMPPLGRDTVTRAKIEHSKNEWARRNGFSASDLVTMQAAYAGDKESLKKFQTQRDQIASFEETAKKNLDLMLAAGQKLIDTGSPWLNRPLRAINLEALGSDEQAAFKAAQLIANNEVAKVTSGGGLGGVVSDSTKKEMKEAMGENPTISNMMAVAKLLKQDMANRHQSMDATLGDIKQRIGGGGSAAGPAAGGATYKKTASAPNGHKIGTNDNGATWYDVATGQKVQ